MLTARSLSAVLELLKSRARSSRASADSKSAVLELWMKQGFRYKAK